MAQGATEVAHHLGLTAHECLVSGANRADLKGLRSNFRRGAWRPLQPGLDGPSALGNVQGGRRRKNEVKLTPPQSAVAGIGGGLGEI